MSNGVVELLFLLAFFAPPLAVVIGALSFCVAVLPHRERLSRQTAHTRAA